MRPGSNRIRSIMNIIDPDLTILLVEDDIVDRRALIRSLSGWGLEGSVECAADGEEALRLLRNEVPGRKLKSKCIVLLDLNLPLISGFEVLRQMRSDPRLRSVPVFVVSTSTDPRDVALSYTYNAAGYIPKTIDRDRIEELGSLLISYLNIVELPARASKEGTKHEC